MKRHSIPATAAVMAKAEKGANRLNSLLERHIEPAELADSVGAVRARALARFSRKFHKSAREMIENFSSRYGGSSGNALARLISIAVRNEDFSMNYDSWLSEFAKLAEELNTKGMDVGSFYRFSFSGVVGECETLGELSAAVRAVAEYAEKAGHPDSFCKDCLWRVLRLRLPQAELAEFCDVLIERMAALPSEGERSEFGRRLAKRLDEAVLMEPRNAKRMMDFLKG